MKPKKFKISTLKFQDVFYSDTIEITAQLDEIDIANISGHVMGDSVVVGSVFVEPDYRGNGIGLFLYESLCKLAAKKGLQNIYSQDASDAARVVHRKFAEKYSLPLPKGEYDYWSFKNPFT